MPRIIVLNGPPRAGKDVAAKAIVDFFGEEFVEHIKLSKPLKDLVALVMGSTHEALEAEKDVPTAFGMNMSYRDAQIGVFEAISKVFGETWIARAGISQINQSEKDIVVLSDGGRPSDVDTLIRQYGARNIFVLQIFRKGTTFQNDIRQYINDSRVVTSVVLNDDLTRFTTAVVDEVTQWMET